MYERNLIDYMNAIYEEYNTELQGQSETSNKLDFNTNSKNNLFLQDSNQNTKFTTNKLKKSSLNSCTFLHTIRIILVKFLAEFNKFIPLLLLYHCLLTDL